jgi:DNA modification methylase
VTKMPTVVGTLPRRRVRSKFQASSPRSARRKVIADMRRGLAKQIVWRLIGALKPFPKNPRRHPEAQIAALMKNIRRVWTIPILIDENETILAGHLRLEAAKRLGMTEVPTIMIAGLSENEKRAVVIADNRLPEQAVWDFDLLREHFKELIEYDFDVELTGFSTGEADLILDGNTAQEQPDAADDVSTFAVDGPAISKQGDLWRLGRHLLLCGSSLDPRPYEHLLQGHLAQMVVTDPPYNVPIAGHAMGRGKIHHRNFQSAAGEMSPEEFTCFLGQFIRHAITFSRDGSIHYIFMDWRHLPELLNAARALYTEWKNLLVWSKNNAGQGSFYRSKHELIAVFKNGSEPHINNFGLGSKGRHRTNVLDYPSVNSLHPARRGDLALHPTVKPVALIADLIRDCSKRNGLILDPFGGSGTTILAAERTGRIARLIELDPLYVDVAVRRWEKIIGVPARHATSGLSFEQVAAERGVDAGANEPPRPPESMGGCHGQLQGRLR